MSTYVSPAMKTTLWVLPSCRPISTLNLTAKPNTITPSSWKGEGLGIGWENSHSTFHSVLSDYQHKTYVVLYSWLTTSKEEMTTSMNYPVDILQFANPSVILSTIPAKLIISHHWCFILNITLKIILFMLACTSLHFKSPFNLQSLILQWPLPYQNQSSIHS